MTDASSVNRRSLALWFPFLPADRLRIQQPDTATLLSCSNTSPDAPLALVAKVKGALRLAAVDARALRQGLTPGMTLADARALHADLRVAEMDPAADRHWLEWLAQRCIDWSPRVTIDHPDGITLDIAGSEHLFGGEPGLIGLVEDRMAALGMTVRLAAAAAPEAARALARHAGRPAEADERAAIRALPVAALGLDAEAERGLRRAGLKTVGDLAARPAATIAARFGMEAVTALHRLTGEVHVPIEPIAPPEPLHFEHRFPEPVALQSSIAACLRDLLHRAVEALARRELGGRRFMLSLQRSDGVRHQLRIETGRPTRDPGLVMRLFDERIGTLADPLDPGFGYDGITLAIPRAEPLPASQPELDGRAQDGEALAELVDRLSTRLGAGSLRRLVPRDSHIPEQAQLPLPAIETRLPACWPPPPPGEPPLRPLFLLDPPQPVEVIAEVPDGPPHRFRWQRRLHEVRLYEGPERIGAEWWRVAGGHEGHHEGPGGSTGQRMLTRDYYRIEDVRGRRYWIFRHGLYEEKPDPRWYLHGLFA